MRVGLAAIPAVVLAGGLPAWRCSLHALPHELASLDLPAPVATRPLPVQAFQTQTAPKHEERVTREQLRPPTPASPIKPFYTFPDHVIMHALGVGEHAFLRCFQRAQRRDPLLTAAKVQIHLELDASGAIVAAQSDATGALSNCLVGVARHLPWPAPGKHAVVDAPLFFRD